MSIDIVTFEAETTKRYLTDPRFHARVNVAVEVTAVTMRRATGMAMGQDFAAAVTQACAYGLMMAEIDITPNLDEETIASMRREADKLGFQVIQGAPENG